MQEIYLAFCISFFLSDRLTNECEGLKKQIRELTANIDEPFQGSADELKLLISNFQRDQDKKKRELQDVRIFSVIIHHSFTKRQLQTSVYEMHCEQCPKGTWP